MEEVNLHGERLRERLRERELRGRALIIPKHRLSDLLFLN